MKEIVLNYDGSSLYSKNGEYVCAVMLTDNQIEEAPSVNVVELVKLGVKPDEIVKLRANGLI